MTDPLRVRVSGPLEPFAVGFAAELSRRGYARDSVVLQLHLMAHLSRWLECERLAVGELRSAAEVERFVAARRVRYTHHVSSRALVPLLECLRATGVVASPAAAAWRSPAEALLERYRCHLVSERGLRAETAEGYVERVRPFVAEHVTIEGSARADVTAADVSAFVLAACGGRSVGSAKLTVTALRSLLRFLHVEGLLEVSLSEAVPAVAGWRLAGLPRALDAGAIRALLAGCDRHTVVGRRDFAILMLLTRLALRAGELVRLRLEDVDWHAGELVIRGKGDRHERLPLPTVASYCTSSEPVLGFVDVAGVRDAFATFLLDVGPELDPQPSAGAASGWQLAVADPVVDGAV